MATPTTTINVTTQKADNVLELQALMTGITTLLPHVDPFLLSRQTYPRADLLARVQARLDAAIATKNARITLHNVVDAERNAQAAFKGLHASFRAYLVAVYGANAPELQQFGYVQNRKPKRTAQTKADAALKAKATRTARGTKGKKQKAAIHGAPPPTAATATPPAATTAPAASPTPPAAPSLHIAAAPGTTNTPTS
jgi:hypothetical protein